MFGFLLLLFAVVTLTEIWLIVQVNQVLGGWETFGLLILDSAIGAWLVKREGMSILAKIQRSLGEGELPTNALIDGLLVLVAGALMLTPGFLTDGLGLLLLLPPTRAIVREILKKRFAWRVQVGGGAFAGGFGPGFSPGSGFGGFTDVDASDISAEDDGNEPPGAIELGPTSD
ncbi:MAG: FxsA family protein [Acidimicrobiales bacterium]|nr:FxsA family protein [Acidimicrobiales bacterium]